MLWFVGVMALVIDIFFRISIPIDQLYRHKDNKNASTDLLLNATELPLLDTAPLPNAIIIDEKGISLLLDRLGVPPGEMKGMIKTIQNVPLSKVIDKDSQQSADSQQTAEKFLNDGQNDNKGIKQENKQKTRYANESQAVNADDGKENVATSAEEESSNDADSPS